MNKFHVMSLLKKLFQIGPSTGSSTYNSQPIAAAVQLAPGPAGAEPGRPRLQRQAHATRLHCLVDALPLLLREEWRGGRIYQLRWWRVAICPALWNSGVEKGASGRRCEWWKCGDVKERGAQTPTRPDAAVYSCVKFNVKLLCCP
jgi:hypothetical protein